MTEGNARAGKGRKNEPGISARLAAEALGTFIITAAAEGVDILYRTNHSTEDVSRWLTRGFATAVVIYAFSETSGAHANPAVTLGFVLRGVFKPALMLAYWLAQFAGSFIAVVLLLALFGQPGIALGASKPGPGYTPLEAMLCEAVLTFVLMVIILMTATEKGVVGKQAAVAVGFAVAMCGFSAGAISGASMNPARTIAPQLMSGLQALSWIYACGPLVGAVMAVGVVWLIAGPPNRDEQAAAQGDQNVPDASSSALSSVQQ